jgi:hypothetical protein
MGKLLDEETWKIIEFNCLWYKLMTLFPASISRASWFKKAVSHLNKIAPIIFNLVHRNGLKESHLYYPKQYVENQYGHCGVPFALQCQKQNQHLIMTLHHHQVHRIATYTESIYIYTYRLHTYTST